MDEDLRQTFFEVLALGKQIKERTGSEPLLPPEAIIYQMRQERAEHIQNLLDKSREKDYAE